MTLGAPDRAEATASASASAPALAHAPVPPSFPAVAASPPPPPSSSSSTVAPAVPASFAPSAAVAAASPVASSRFAPVPAPVPAPVSVHLPVHAAPAPRPASSARIVSPIHKQQHQLHQQERPRHPAPHTRKRPMSATASDRDEQESAARRVRDMTLGPDGEARGGVGAGRGPAGAAAAAAAAGLAGLAGAGGDDRGGDRANASLDGTVGGTGGDVVGRVGGAAAAMDSSGGPVAGDAPPPLNKRVRSSTVADEDAMDAVEVDVTERAAAAAAAAAVASADAAERVRQMEVAAASRAVDHAQALAAASAAAAAAAAAAGGLGLGGTSASGIMANEGSDAGSSSCKDVEDPGVLAPDSVPAMVAEIRKLLDYVASKPTLQCGSASFMRDYLRTMLIKSSAAAEEAVAEAARAVKNPDCMDITGATSHASFFRTIPDELAKHIFSFLEGKNLAVAREVCQKWNEFACEEPLWKELCLKRWRALETDKDLWKLIDKNVMSDQPNSWRRIYPTVSTRSQWPCRLQKTGRFICNLIAHQISGAPLGPNGLPKILVVERRFNILHLQTFVLPDASVLYFEPEEESDRAGFNDFIDYLTKRTRAGLALEDQRRFIFIPPCDYTKTQVGYNGNSLLGVIQSAYPPLAP